MSQSPTWVHDAAVKVNCKDCTAVCCKHIAVPFEEPVTPEDFAAVRLWLSHENVIVYKDNEDDWVVEFQTKCGNLVGNRCSVYGGKEYPRVCGEYEMNTCVMNEEGDWWQILFKTIEDVDAYCREKDIAIIPYAGVADCITIGLDTPTSPADLDDFWWYVAHRDVTVYRKGDEWFLHCNTACLPSCSVKRVVLPSGADVVFRSWSDIATFAREQFGVPEGHSPLTLSAR
ncbi:TPA: hypothetical protein HA251_06420 [Candidatus Woesearchaeota archaeon]|nr:hypothetical protein [Candidatus Woesearchaeota archaeon]